jgi:DNA-binding HxlR family transcriptional regulator
VKRKGYDQLCGVSAALDVVGDRWALLIVRELQFSPKRFTDLHRGLPGIGTRTLTVRLGELEAAGIIEHTKTPPPLPSTAYVLTARGRELTPVLVALLRWGSREFVHLRPTHPLQPAWLGVAMLSCYDPTVSFDRPVQIGLAFDEGSLRLTLGTDRLEIAEGPGRQGQSSAVDLELSAPSPAHLLTVLLGHRERLTELTVSGDERLLEPFLDAFPLGGRGGVHHPPR